MDTNGARESAAFTLLELLVVIAVVAVLAAIAFPVLNTVRDSGNSAKCVSNLRQIFAGLTLYAQEHNNTLPQRMYGSDNGGQKVGYSEMILPYVDPGHTPANCDAARKVFACPTHGLHYPAEPGYGLNWFYDNANLASVPRAAQTIMLAETLGTGGTGSRRANRDNTASDIGKLDITRHRGKANYLYFDGHTERLTYDQTRLMIAGAPGDAAVDQWGVDDNDHGRAIPPLPY